MKDLCQEIAQSNISEIGVATACKQLTDISREMKVENVTAFASSLLMPQVGCTFVERSGSGVELRTLD